MDYRISNHCLEQIELRGISVDDIHGVLSNPGMILKQDEEISIYQSLSRDNQFVFRIFVNVAKQPKLVVTAYKTSKITKYYEDKI
jgi:hypothetical protein